MRDQHVLMLKVDDRNSGHTFWVIPGGGRIAGEHEEDCVRREVFEETLLAVDVIALLDEDVADGVYQRTRTYLCRVKAGEPSPGVEPEVDSPEHATIRAVGWFDMRDPSTWDELALADPLTFPRRQRLRRALGYG